MRATRLLIDGDPSLEGVQDPGSCCAAVAIII
jgi:hypothetical protein